MDDASTYRIEKTRLPVTIRVRGGRVLEGFVFAQNTTAGGHEEVADILNASDAYFPLQFPSGATVLVAKSHVLEAMPDAPVETDDVRRATAREAGVELLLEDGTCRQGFVLMEMPHERPRVLDYLNAGGPRFVTVYVGASVSLINRGAISSVRPQD